MGLKAVLFDLFDTLLLLDDVEVYYPACLRQLHGFLVTKGVKESFEEFEKTYLKVREEFIKKAHQTLEEPHFNIRVSQTLQRLGYTYIESDPTVVGATKAFGDELKKHVSLDVDAIDTLKQLRAEYKLGIVSNLGIPECGRELLNDYGLKPFFDVVVISGEINRRKPSPEIYNAALKSLNVTASDTVFVGDTPELDIDGPKKMEMRAILIERKPINEKPHLEPDATIHRLTELPSILKSFQPS
jgi:HAD superfamily hydrolase (TIGR01509 family)